jgi:hypothetical protein
MNAVDREEAIRNTVPGSKWYQCIHGKWHAVEVKKVTKTTVVLLGGTCISKATCRDHAGRIWFPPTQDLVLEVMAKKDAMTSYLAALEKLRAIAQWATADQLRQLVTQMESLIDLVTVNGGIGR